MRLVAAMLALSLAAMGQNFNAAITLIPKADDSATGVLAFREKKANGTDAVGLRAPNSIAASVTWTLPSVDGSANYCLTTNGSATLSWSDCGAGIWQRNTGLGQVSFINASDDLVLTGGDILFTPTNTSNIGTAANYANAMYSRRFEVSDGTYSRVVLTTAGAGSNAGNAIAAKNASDSFVFYVTYGGSTQMVNAVASGTLTVGGNATFSGHILNDTAGTKDIGASSNTFQTLYVENVDAAPSGQTGNYVNTRKLNVLDGSGGTSFWDVQANATVSNADNYKIRDKGGVVRFELVNKEEVTWSALSEGRMNLHWVPYASATWDLGKAGGLWRDLHLSRNAAIGGDATVTGMVKVDVIRPDADSQTTVRTLYPEAADTYGLGTWVNRFLLVAASQVTTNRINFGSGSTIELYGNLRPLTNNTFALGESSYRYSKLWVVDLDMSGSCTGCPGGMWTRTVGGGVGGTNIISQTTAADEIVSSANLYPSADNTRSLGLSSRKWSDVHSVFATFTSNVSVGGTFSVTSTSTFTGNATFAGDILANANESKNIGSTTNRFNAVYSRRFEAYDGTSSRIVLNNPGSGSNAGNAIAVKNAADSFVFYVTYGGTTQAANLAASGTFTVAGVSTLSNNLDVGAASGDHRIKAHSGDGTISAQLFAFNGLGGFVGTLTNHTFYFRTNDTDRWVLETGGHFRPQANNLYTLGASSYRASNLYSVLGNFSGSLTVADIVESSNEAHNIGSTSSRFNAVYSRRFEAYDGSYSRIVLNNPGSGSNAGNAIALKNASDSFVFYVTYSGTTQAVNLAASGTLSVSGASTLGNLSLTGNVTFGTHNAYSIGTSGTRAAAIYGVAVDGSTVTAATLNATAVGSNLTPSSDSGWNLGTQSTNWNYVYADGTFYIIYGASSIRHEYGQNGITLRTTGLATSFSATASSGNVVGGTITSGTSTTSGGYYISDGTTTYSGLGTVATPTTLNVRKSDDSGGCTITIRGGIVTASTC